MPRHIDKAIENRRFLRRTSASYDVITIDPPPPIYAAGSSLLYSREFCEAVRRRPEYPALSRRRARSSAISTADA